MTIRKTVDDDLETVLDIHRRAFGEEDEAALVRLLLSDPTARPALSLIAAEGSAAVGHILFTAVRLNGAERPVRAAILCPMAVLPEAQRGGIGTALIREGLDRLRENGVDLVFVLGWPDYYSRFGFEPAGRRGLDAPYPIKAENADAWMVRPLCDGVLGRVHGTVACAKSLNREEYWVE